MIRDATRRGATAPRKANSRAAKAGTGFLTRAELKELRKMLVEKRRQLVGDLGELARAALQAPVRGDGESPDVGSDAYERDVTLELMENEHGLLREIDEALQRLDRGTYGYCLLEGEPISEARLRARPWARLCIDCAKAVERRGGLDSLTVLLDEQGQSKPSPNLNRKGWRPASASPVKGTVPPPDDGREGGIDGKSDSRTHRKG